MIDVILKENSNIPRLAKVLLNNSFEIKFNEFNFKKFLSLFLEFVELNISKFYKIAKLKFQL